MPAPGVSTIGKPTEPARAGLAAAVYASARCRGSDGSGDLQRRYGRGGWRLAAGNICQISRRVGRPGAGDNPQICGGSNSERSPCGRVGRFSATAQAVTAGNTFSLGAFDKLANG